MLNKKPKLRGGGDFETIPEGMYTLQILDVDEATWEYKGEEKTGFNFKFAILDDDELDNGKTTRGRFLWWRVSDAISKRANLHKLAVAAFGRALTDDEQDSDSEDQLNPNDLVGEQIVASVVNNEDNDGRTWSNIVAVSRAKRKLEAVDYESEEAETKKTVTKPAKRVVEEEEDEEEDPKHPKLPNLNPALDDAIEGIERKKKKAVVEEDEDEEGDLDDPKPVKKKKVVEEEEDEDDDDEEMAALEEAAKKAKARLEAKKLEKRGK